MSSSSAARTNLTSQRVQINRQFVYGDGAFRIAYAGTYIGGNRNNQEAVCKCFKLSYLPLEKEFYETDKLVIDRAIQYAEEWNVTCSTENKILITKGDVMQLGDRKYLVEPLIRYFTKFTSNNGWIASDNDVNGMHDIDDIEVMEAFTHYTYHRSGGQMIVCDLQGRYRNNQYSKKKCRFELTDPAICSRMRKYGPTDLGEKGIESFFANHVCNNYCHHDGNRWSQPRYKQNWFVKSSSTSMLRSTATNFLNTRNTARFNANLQPFYEDDDDSDDYDY